MNAEEIRDYALAKPDVEECFPFGEGALVFKIKGRMFLLISLDSKPLWFNVKCDPELALELREKYEDIRPGYHMNKKHWNSVYLNGGISRIQILEMIDHSYDLVRSKR